MEKLVCAVTIRKYAPCGLPIDKAGFEKGDTDNLEVRKILKIKRRGLN